MNVPNPTRFHAILAAFLAAKLRTLFLKYLISFQNLNSIMQYASRKANVGVFLIIPGMGVMIYGRLLSLLESSSPPDSLVVIIAEFMLIGGGIAAIFGAILLAIGIPETKRNRIILDIALVGKEVTISEISTKTGLNVEYVRKTVSDLVGTGFLDGFLEHDRFVNAMAKDTTS